MATLEFREINSENRKACENLDAGDNGKFVASNKYSIDEKSFITKWDKKAVYYENEMVGFVMYNISYLKRELYLCRFMIDKKHQGKGYGLEVLKELRNIAEKNNRVSKLRLSTNPLNENGIRIYKKFGFRDTGKMDHGEEVFEYNLNKR